MSTDEQKALPRLDSANTRIWRRDCTSWPKVQHLPIQMNVLKNLSRHRRNFRNKYSTLRRGSTPFLIYLIEKWHFSQTAPASVTHLRWVFIAAPHFLKVSQLETFTGSSTSVFIYHIHFIVCERPLFHVGGNSHISSRFESQYSDSWLDEA